MRINNDFFITMTGICFGIFVGIGKLIFGWLYDRFPVIDLLNIGLIGVTVSCFMFYLFAYSYFSIIFIIIIIGIFGKSL
jgi:predicted MFS family arabinose efflux permease